MLFERRLRDGLKDGSITLAFRRWKRPQATAHGRYRTGDGAIAEVTSVEIVEEITEPEARAAGYPGLAALLADLNSRGPDSRGPDSRGLDSRGLDFRGGEPIYRLELRLVDEADPRDTLAESTDLDVGELTRRLDRMGPWALAALKLIAAHPGRRAADLAPRVGLEREPFKINVRKLKNLGLTLSLETGYRISPRGQAYLTARQRLGDGTANQTSRSDVPDVP